MKLTKLEKFWILYDVGNSAFTLLIATILPIYFNYLAEAGGICSADYLAYWGYAASVCTLIVAFIGPIFGALADTKGYKKPIFLASIFLGAIGCIAMGWAKQWLVFLVIFVIAKVGYSASLVFYDAMLGDVTTPERSDVVSTHGYAWGYIGSCIPFAVCLVLVLLCDYIGITMEQAMMASFIIMAIWWVALSLPLAKHYKQKHYVEKENRAFLESFRRIGRTLFHMKQNKKAFLFLLAFFFYIDGVYTIIDMATAYGSALGLDSTGLLLALLVTQIVAFPFAILFGRLAKRYDTEKLIFVCIVAYFGIAVFAIFLHTQLQFWMLACMVGMFQGGIQALSRSYFSRIIPRQQAGEYFGLMDICGKGASFIGTTAVGLVSQITGNINIAVGVLAIMFILGMIFFIMTTKVKEEQNA